ncbi:hypothetical protein ScPMuIL_004651 [Solemya velum]
MEFQDCDVVIVGGGLSGLSAAFYLLKRDRGLKIKVLEAKGRVGGRIHSVQLKSADGNVDFWDVGGEWVGKPQTHLRYLLRKFSLDTFNPQTLHSNPDHVPDVPGASLLTRLDLMQFQWKLKKLKKKFDSIDLHSSVNALQCDGMTFDTYKEDNLWTMVTAKEIVDAACRCMFGLLPTEMTLLYFLMYINSAGGLSVFTRPEEYTGRESRVKGGLLQLSTHLVHRVGKKNILLDQPVTHIIQSYDKVTVVTTNNLQIQCMRVILAIPPHQAAIINYNPALPSEKLNLLRNVPLAFIVKFIFSYDESFWKNRISGQGKFGFQCVLQDGENPVGIVYDGTSARGNPALVGFLSTSRGPGMEQDPKVRLDAIVNLLEDVLGNNVRNYIDTMQMDWSKEPYNGGCFLKSLIPGTTKYFNQTLRERFDRIHFGGTETGTVWCGLMNGAVQSGFRAATEVLYHLRPQIITSSDPEKNLLFEVEQPTDMGPLKVLGYITVGAGLTVLFFTLFRGKRFAHVEQTLLKLVTT